jgi:hypothetical protein
MHHLSATSVMARSRRCRKKRPPYLPPRRRISAAISHLILTILVNAHRLFEHFNEIFDFADR